MTDQDLEAYDAMTVDRDHWKARFKKLENELMCELRDPNGTIWDHAKSLQDQLDLALNREAAIKDFCEVEMGWEFFRAEMMITDTPTKTLQNAKKLQEYLRENVIGMARRCEAPNLIRRLPRRRHLRLVLLLISSLRRAIRAIGCARIPSTNRPEEIGEQPLLKSHSAARVSKDLMYVTPNLAIWKDTGERYRLGERPTRSEPDSCAATSHVEQNNSQLDQCLGVQTSQLLASGYATGSYCLADLLTPKSPTQTSPLPHQDSDVDHPSCLTDCGAFISLQNSKLSNPEFP